LLQIRLVSLARRIELVFQRGDLVGDRLLLARQAKALSAFGSKKS
jgi:hypothetical protein